MIINEKYITVKLTDELMERIKKHDTVDFSRSKKNIRNSGSGLIGSVGEVVSFDFYKSKGVDVKFDSAKDHDLIINGYSVEIKTKATNSVPKDNYLCGVPCISSHQQPDYYFFLRVNFSLKECYLLGWISKSDFVKKSFKKEKGEKDVNGWVFKTDCNNIMISQLNKFTT